MASIELQAVVKRAFLDDTFRLGLVKHFDETIAELNLDLSADEVKALSDVNWQTLGMPAGGGGSWVHIYST